MCDGAVLSEILFVFFQNKKIEPREHDFFVLHKKDMPKKIKLARPYIR